MRAARTSPCANCRTRSHSSTRNWSNAIRWRSRSSAGSARCCATRAAPTKRAKAIDAALTLSAELLGDRHPTTLALHRQRAAVYMEQGWLDVAERDLRDTTPLLIERVGEDHVDVGSSFYTLGCWPGNRAASTKPSAT
jgi:hypothetical protein